MQASSVIAEAGEIVPAALPGTDTIVHATAMHANFMVRSIHDFCQADFARLEAGTPDDLGYLARAMSLIMSVAQQEQRFAEICREHKGNREEIGRRMQSVLEAHKGGGIDTSGLEAQIYAAQVHGVQLDVAANMHDATVGEVAVVLNSLQERVDALLQPSVLGYVAGRRN